MLKIHSLKFDKKSARQALSAEELERFRDACENYRDKALVEFLVSSGCRLSEVAGLNMAALNFAERSVTVHGEGGQRPCCVFLSSGWPHAPRIQSDTQGRGGVFCW